ncbi:MAG: bifunctional phosphoribosyl-AMP cyclohydrolase/phosphoribosyl-ATP diphosphatase HisIE [Proteobacteria bacterium]|nr:bifunctional phosphoribosyl-AMP cyclohydrolase/phosphoribosyl-ATP diphosphatase HisIE [Pseudomonadota bacterium]
MTPSDLERIDFNKGGGLAPAIVQDADTLRVLMLAYMDRAALEETISSGEATFFSRSRGERWRKGETSGNSMKVRSLSADCDRDTILLQVEPAGPACHLGTETCFGQESELGFAALARLERTIAKRAVASTEESYTARLLVSGVKRVAQKVGEEAVECALAGAAGSNAELCEEAADLLYHLAVLMHARGLSLRDACAVLERRSGASP